MMARLTPIDDARMRASSIVRGAQPRIESHVALTFDFRLDRPMKIKDAR